MPSYKRKCPEKPKADPKGHKKKRQKENKEQEKLKGAHMGRMSSRPFNPITDPFLASLSFFVMILSLSNRTKNLPPPHHVKPW